MHYDKHPSEWINFLKDPKKIELGKTWRDKGTLDYWRHERLRRAIVPIVKQNLNLSWLTIGDGRYGTDANYLLSLGVKHVHCTDISDVLLKIGSAEGFINDFSSQNAESLSFLDDSFDYILCKDALHHFPRPYVALSEMFRVTRNAVILIEPRDQLIDRAGLSFLYGLLRKLFLREKNDHGFEEIGNYVYSISERELEKFLLGQHYTSIAYNPINDAYFEGVEFIPMDAKHLKNEFIKIKLILKIFFLDFFTKLGFMKSGTIRVALFKLPPSPDLVNKMKLSGWKFKLLPKNPYL